MRLVNNLTCLISLKWSHRFIILQRATLNIMCSLILVYIISIGNSALYLLSNFSTFTDVVQDAFQLFTTQSRLLTSLKKKPFENIVEKEESQHFSAFPTLFSTHPKTNVNFSIAFIICNTFHSDQSKILSFGKGLNAGINRL